MSGIIIGKWRYNSTLLGLELKWNGVERRCAVEQSGGDWSEAEWSGAKWRGMERCGVE
jgi:hypothetical protein